MTSVALSSPPAQFVPIPTAVPTPAEIQVVQFGVEIPNRVFVGGCPYNMTEKELADFFKQFGPIKDTKIVFDKATGKSLGYGFVTYVCEADAISVYSKGSIYYKEKKLNVSKAVRKQGGQFVRPNQEYINGSVLIQPNSYYVTQDGLWTPYQVPSHAQPVKPYYTVYVGQNVQQPGVAYSLPSPTLAPMGTGYMLSPLSPPSPVEQRVVSVQEITSEVQPTGTDPQNTSTDSAYSSDDHTPSNDSSQGTGEVFQGVDLDRLFERRHLTNGRKPYNRRNRQEPCFISPTGLLPTQALVGGYLQV